jgi:hypothetical protein
MQTYEKLRIIERVKVAKVHAKGQSPSKPNGSTEDCFITFEL